MPPRESGKRHKFCLIINLLSISYYSLFKGFRMISGISSSNTLDSFFVNKSETKKNDAVFSILSEEVGLMLAGDEKEDSRYSSIFSKEADRKAQLTKTKLDAEGNPFQESKLPDAIFNKIKELFPDKEKRPLVPVEGNRPLTHAYFNTERTWLTIVVTMNAIIQSGGQEEMKIIEENVDWEKVFQATANGFQDNMKPAHTEEIGAHYREYLDNPMSPYYFYSDEDKVKMVEAFKKQNYESNCRLFDAAETLMADMRGEFYA